MNEVIELLRERVTLGEPRSKGALTLVPVFGGEPARPYAVGGSALKEGTLVIGESGGGSVPTLVAENHGTLPALLVDGEHLEGAMQDRILNVSVLLPAEEKTTIPVTCVEQGRWSYGGDRSMTPSRFHAPPRVRRVNRAALAAAVDRTAAPISDQGGVWEEVRSMSSELAVRSGTGAMRDVFDSSTETLEEIAGAFDGPELGQVGVVAIVAGRAVAADIFDRPETLASFWTRLVHAYALESMGKALLFAGRDEAERFLSDVVDGEVAERDGVGLGRSVVVAGEGAVASALVWEGKVVHLAMSSREDARPQARAPRPGEPVRRPWEDLKPRRVRWL